MTITFLPMILVVFTSAWGRHSRNRGNILRVGSTRSGKSKAAARYAVEWPGALVVLDPHRNSLATDVLRHVKGKNVLYECLSDVDHSLGWDFLTPSIHSNPARRAMENEQSARCFVDILMREQGGPRLEATPLKREWVLASIHLYLSQRERKSLRCIPFALRPGTADFNQLLENCTKEALRWKFEKLRTMTFRSLRTEVGSAERLLAEVCECPALSIRARGGFDYEGFLDASGKLVVERGDEVSDVAMRLV